jgi:tRNA(Ile2) C34 agmatinyltransferase TiaS
MEIIAGEWRKPENSVYHPIMLDLQLERRPSCPRCESTYVISHGNYWSCEDCGRRWLKMDRHGRA